MAVALATLPLKSLLAGDGAGWLAAAAGLGGATCVAAALCPDAAGLTAGFLAAPGPGAAFLTTGPAGAGFLGPTFPAAAFFTGAFLTGAFFAAALFGATFFAGAFPDADFLAIADLGATFFAVAPAPGLATVLAEDVRALFTIRSLLAPAFDLPASLAGFAEVLPWCALAAVELAFVFAISLHRDWPWRPGVIADVFHTGKHVSGILVPLHAAHRSGNVNILTRLILWLLHLYKRWLSPLFGSRCRFHPTCSDYARIAVERFGPWRGSLLAGWRLLRCQPLCDGGEDQVPGHFHFPRCHHHDESGDAG